jgi:hypothetical protein
MISGRKSLGGESLRDLCMVPRALVVSTPKSGDGQQLQGSSPE